MSASADKVFLVIAGLGPDRPGLVAELALHVTSRGGNVEESRMAILGAEFGVMVVVSGTSDEIATIERELPQLETKTKLGFLLRRTKEPSKNGGLPCRIVATALDQEGIVHSLADSLRTLGVNVVSLETSAYHASMSGAPLFRFEALVDVPKSVGLGSVRDAMTQIARKLDLDIDVGAAS